MNKEQEKIVHDLWFKATTSKYECKDYPSMICRKEHVIKVLELLVSYENALDRACEKLHILDCNLFCAYKSKKDYKDCEEWKRWCLSDE